MLIKSAQSRSDDLDALERLLGHPAASPSVRSRIEQEMRMVRAGAKGEAEAAYEIDFHHAASRNWAVIHDLRIEWQGRVAQIDHLLINRLLDVWVCESKHFAEGVSINEQGEFTAFAGSRPYGVPSPLEQNRKHIDMLERVLSSSIFQLPMRLGIPIRPKLHSAVLVSKGARITRPKTATPGLDRLIKNDQLRSLVEKVYDEQVGVLSLAKLVAPETLESFARQLAALHRPIRFNWPAKFGLEASERTPAAVEPATPRGGVIARRPASPAAAVEGAKPGAAAAPITPAVQPAENAHEGRLSTSKLAAARGVKSTREMLEALTRAGYLKVEGESHVLTPMGATAGALFIEKSRFGPYFVWPVNIAV